MNKKVVIIIFLLLTTWFAFGLTGWPVHLDLIYLVPPLFIGFIILIKFGRDDVAKCIGFLSLKPMLNLLLVYLPRTLDLYGELNSIYPYNIIRAVSWVIPELFLTIFIVYAFWGLFSKDRFAMLFLIGDLIRWLSVFILLYIPDPNPEPFFYPQLYVLIFFTAIFPSTYAVYGLFVVQKHAESKNIAS